MIACKVAGASYTVSRAFGKICDFYATLGNGNTAEKHRNAAVS